jgi:hypothetical protein
VLFGYEVLAEIFLGSNQVKIVMQGIVFGSFVNAALMAGHTDIFPKNLFWYHLFTALAYKTL